MGQLVAVVEKPSNIPGVLRFESNRTLTGQGHETFRCADDAVGPRPAAVLARRLLSTGQVESVHMYSNMVTVNLQKGFAGIGLDEVVRDLYQYWKPGMVPKTFEAPADEPASAGATPASDGAAGDSAYTRLVPEVLRERSSLAMAKWKAGHGG
jgi:hypothetical protein